MDRGFRLLPIDASAFAGQVDTLFFSLLGLGGAMTFIVAALILVLAVRYRRRNVVDRELTLRAHRLEFAWSVVPLLLFMGLFAWGAQLYVSVHSPPEDALRIHGIGRQWMWKFQHPGGQREINELHVPLGRPVELLLASQDVIHSFFVPAFRAKQDAVPGHVTSTWFTATRSGEFRLFCAEYCGTSHARMQGRVVVMSADEYQAWLASRAPALSRIEQGERLYDARGCSTCHDGQSSVSAPPLEGIYGRTITLSDGSTVVADETYLRDAILLPNRDVVAGYEAVMPTYSGQLDEEAVLSLLAYLRALGQER